MVWSIPLSAAEGTAQCPHFPLFYLINHFTLSLFVILPEEEPSVPLGARCCADQQC